MADGHGRKLNARLLGEFDESVSVLDKGFDAEVVYSEIENRHIRPIIPLVKTKSVKEGKHKPPTCEHGEWVFAGSDTKRGASKWRCPTGECDPKSSGSRRQGCICWYRAPLTGSVSTTASAARSSASSAS